MDYHKARYSVALGTRGIRPRLGRGKILKLRPRPLEEQQRRTVTSYTSLRLHTLSTDCHHPCCRSRGKAKSLNLSSQPDKIPCSMATPCSYAHKAQGANISGSPSLAFCDHLSQTLCSLPGVLVWSPYPTLGRHGLSPDRLLLSYLSALCRAS